MAEPTLTTRRLTKRFGDLVAVRELDLTVGAGTVVGCIGPSGSGKSTTVRLLTGILRPTSGEALVFGVPPTALNPGDRARIGYMPQLNVLYPHLSIAENLSFVASLYGVRPDLRRARIGEALEFVELAPDRRKLLREASGGMQRRVALAATMVHQPDLLFLDEPTAGVDPVLRRKFWDHFGRLQQEGRTLFVTTQYVGEAAYCDHVAVLSEGRLLLVETPEGLRQRAYGGDLVDLAFEEPLDPRLLARIPALSAQPRSPDGRRVRVLVPDAGEAIPRLYRWLGEQGVGVASVEQHLPPFDDVFVILVEQHRGASRPTPDGEP